MMVSKRQLNEGELDEDDIKWLIIKTFKYDLLKAVVNYVIDILFRTAFSVVILYLL